MEPSRRGSGWKVAVPVLLAMFVALAVLAVSCDGTSSTGAAGDGSPVAGGGGPSDADVASLDDPADASSTTDPASETTSTTSPTATTAVPLPGDGGGGSGGGGSPGAETATTPLPASAADCAALEAVVLPAAAIITEDDFVPAAERPPGPSPVDRVGPLRQVAAIVPARHRAAWEAVAASAASAQAEGRPATEPEVAAFRSARNAVEVWARTACPGAPPSWRCDHFGSAGNGPDEAPSRPQATTAAGALRRNSNADAARELVRTDDTVLYGWTDDAGFVTRTVQVERVGDGWATARIHTCHDDP